MNNKDTLYNIANEYNEFNSVLEDVATDNEGEIPSELMEMLDSLDNDFTGKVVKCCYIRKELEANIQKLKDEEDRLKRRRNKFKKRIEYLNKYIINNMEVAGKRKIETPILTAYIRSNRASVTVIDADKIPDRFLHNVIRIDIDKNAIYDEWKKNNQAIDGVEIKSTKSFIISKN